MYLRYTGRPVGRLAIVGWLMVEFVCCRMAERSKTLAEITSGKSEFERSAKNKPAPPEEGAGQVEACGMDSGVHQLSGSTVRAGRIREVGFGLLDRVIKRPAPRVFEAFALGDNFFVADQDKAHAEVLAVL